MRSALLVLLLVLVAGSVNAVSVRLDVDAVNVTDLAGVQLSLNYSQGLSFIGSSQGTFLSQNGFVQTIFLPPVVSSVSINDSLVVRLPEYTVNASSFTISKPTISINFSDVVNTVPDYFYGAVLTGAEVNGSDIYPVAGGPGVKSDFLWHQQMLGIANVNYGRADMGFECSMPNPNRVTRKTGASALCNINLRKAQVKYQYDTGGKFLLIAAYMPTWLSDNRSNCVSNRQRCMPSNMTTWTEIVVQYIDEVTENGTYIDAIEVEIWNEAYLGMFFLPDGTKEERASEYSRLYNATYAAIKAKYPQVRVGGPVATYGYADGPYFGDYFFNVTDPSTVDFVTIHEYGDNSLKDDITKAMNRIRAHSGYENKPVKITEWQSSNANVQNNLPDDYMRYMTNAFMRILNTEPNIETMVWYQWQEPNKYSHGAQWFSEYPKNFNMVSEPRLDNGTYVGFRLYNQFGDYYFKGSSITRSNSSSSAVQVMAGEGTWKHFTYTDSTRGATNVSINLTGVSAVSITDMSDSTIEFPVVNGYAIIGPGGNGTRMFRVNEASRPPLGVVGSGTLLSFLFSASANASPNDFGASMLLSDSNAIMLSNSFVALKVYNDGVLWSSSSAQNNTSTSPVQNNTTVVPPAQNSTNITLPVDNSTNITLPVDNSTNITVPSNSTNVTLPVDNSTNVSVPLDYLNQPITVVPPSLGGGGGSSGSVPVVTFVDESVPTASGLQNDNPILKIGSDGVRSVPSSSVPVEKSSAPLWVAAGLISILGGYLLAAAILV